MAHFSNQERSAFIEEYTRLIAQLDQKYQSRLWWATDISSKNRYTSSLPDYAQEIWKGQTPKLSSKSHIKRVKKMAATVYFGLRMLLRAFIARRVLGRDYIKKGQAAYVIKTFAYDSSFDAQGQYHDAFFGRLPEEMRQSANVVMLVNVLGNFRTFLQNAKRSHITLIPLVYFLKPKDVWDAIRDVFSYHVKIDDSIYFHGCDIKDVLAQELYEHLNGIQITQLLHYNCIKRLLEHIEIKTFVMTYENNPWERMCTLALREASPQTKIIGYQHAVVPEAALNMFPHPLNVGILPLPDQIMTVGEETANQLMPYYPQNKIKPACALRYEYLFEVKPQSKQWENHILVVLDGVKQSKDLLVYVLDQLSAYPAYKVIIRAHPALPWDYWQNQIQILPSHIQPSTQALKNDLDWADTVIYWQSTVALEALAKAIPVISFQSPDILSFDPLINCHALRFEVQHEDSLISAIEKVKALSKPQIQDQHAQALSYLYKYFHPLPHKTGDLIRFFK